MEKSPYWEANNHSVKKFPPFIKPEVSLLRSQEPDAGPYLKLDASSQQLPTLSTTHSSIIFPFMPRSSKWSLTFRFSDQHFVSVSHLSHAC